MNASGRHSDLVQILQNVLQDKGFQKFDGHTADVGRESRRSRGRRHLNDLSGLACSARSAASTLCRVLKVSIVRGIIEEAS